MRDARRVSSVMPKIGQMENRPQQWRKIWFAI